MVQVVADGTDSNSTNVALGYAGSLVAAYNDELGFFTQALHGRYADASNLLLPTLGIVDAHAFRAEILRRRTAMRQGAVARATASPDAGAAQLALLERISQQLERIAAQLERRSGLAQD